MHGIATVVLEAVKVKFDDKLREVEEKLFAMEISRGLNIIEGGGATSRVLAMTSGESELRSRWQESRPNCTLNLTLTEPPPLSLGYGVEAVGALAGRTSHGSGDEDGQGSFVASRPEISPGECLQDGGDGA